MSRALAVVMVLFGAACAKQPAVEYGEALFSDPTLSGAKSNAFSCATCHTRVSDVGDVRPGYNLVNVTRRPAWWAGGIGNLFEAVNQCVKSDGGFMGGNGLSRDSDESLALFLYLQSLDDGAAAPALPLTVVKDIVDVPSGDAARGEATYTGVCATCHGAAGTGEGRLASDQSIVPTDTLKGTITVNGMIVKFDKPRLVVIEKIRHGKFFEIGGHMPLFSTEVFSDAQVGDVLAYLEQLGLPGFQK